MPTLICCPYCNANHIRPYAARIRSNFPHHMRTICTRCGLVFANPQATLEELELFYQNYYEKGNFSNWKQDVRDWKQRYDTGRISDRRALSALQRTLVDRGSGRRWVEIGAGLGKLSYIASHKGFDVTITDMDNDALAFARDVMGIQQTHVGDLSTLQLPTASFDVAVLNHVLEHVTDLFGTLSTVRGLLRPGGTIYIGVPNIENWGYRLYRLAAFIRGNIPGIVDGMEHTFAFTPTTLRRCLERAGFRVISLRTIRKDETLGSLFVTARKRGMHKAVVALAETLFHTRMECIAVQVP